MGVTQTNFGYGRVLRANRGCSTIEDWKALAESLVVDPSRVFRRNLEISACYGAAYLRHPALFKWSGMASFASYHVRFLLLPYKLVLTDGDRVDLGKMQRSPLALAKYDLELIREVNNAIFGDIFWAHLAYDGTAEGLAQLERLLTSKEHLTLLEGFRLIEAGRVLLESDPAHAADLIWRGNLRLLWHEQAAVVQRRFSKLTDGFADLLSIGSTLDFEAHRFHARIASFTSFYVFMLTRRLGLLWRTKALPHVTDLDHRWSWIEGRIVPRFRKLDADRGEMSARLGEIERAVGESRAEDPGGPRLGVDDRMVWGR